MHIARADNSNGELVGSVGSTESFAQMFVVCWDVHVEKGGGRGW